MDKLEDVKGMKIHFRAQRFSVVSAQARCWKCGNEIRVYALLLPPGHSCLDALSLTPNASQQPAALVSDLEEVSPSVAEAIRVTTGDLYRKDYSNTAEATYYMNHCQACSAKQGDFFLHAEVDGAFFFDHEDKFHGLSIMNFEYPADLGAASVNHEAGDALIEFFLTGAIPDSAAALPGFVPSDASPARKSPGDTSQNVDTGGDAP